jgi:hypothetical protein
MNDYRIFFGVWNETSSEYQLIELPVNPSEVTITYPANPTNYDVEGVGDVIVPRIPKLATVTFDSFFPREAVFISAANSESWYSPEWYVSFFRKLQMSRKPFELTIIRGSDVINNNSEQFGVFSEHQQYFDTVFPTAVLLDLSITDKGGEPGDVYYSMTISEYRDASPKTLAELAEEKTNEETGEVEQKLVVVINRPPQRGAIVPDRVVEISGEVYEEPESSEIDWATTKQQANRIDRTITRVLPPSVSGTLHSVYVNGLGWVDDKNCRLAEDRGTTTSMKRIITNEYI